MIRKTTFVLLAVALLALGTAGCTQYTGPNQSGGTTPGSAGKMAAGSARLTDADNGKTVDLAVGGTLVIDLEENATTGFSWATTETVPAILTVAGDTQKAAENTSVVGAAGRHIFTFTAASAGEGDLSLIYVRPWESVPPEKTFTVHVVVK